MSTNPGLLVLSFAYFALLFAIAYYTDKRKRQGKRFIAGSYIYALSLAVYCTDWTFYGSVGWAARKGLTFLPIYLGPTLMALLWVGVLRKIIRICKLYSITSIADFIASRYGKNMFLGGFTAFIAVVGILPYIVVQLKAISTTLQLLVLPSGEIFPKSSTYPPIISDPTFYITIVLIIFVILFGERHLDFSERHEGLVATIAFESIIKLLAFLAVGIFVVYGMYNGFSDLFVQARQLPELHSLWDLKASDGSYGDWFFLILLAMMAILLLPRQFQVAVVENVDESHVDRAVWLFPLYLFIINFFVLPIALAGRLYFGDSSVDGDTYMLALPMAVQQIPLTWLVFIGGLSAATGMIIVETIALSNMICNSLVMPILFRFSFFRIQDGTALSTTLLSIRRGAVVIVLLTSFFYFRLIGNIQSLVSTGLISFVAVAQFAPPLLGGLYWKKGNRLGALIGLMVGFLIWFFLLPFNNLVNAGIVSYHFLETPFFETTLANFFRSFQINSMNSIAQAAFWSLSANIGCYITVSLFTKQSYRETTQAELFVDVLRYSDEKGQSRLWRGTAKIEELRALLHRFLGKSRAEKAFRDYSQKEGLDFEKKWKADAKLVQHTEKLLSGAIGTVSARIIVSSVVKEEPPKMEEVMNILDATQQVIAYSQELEKKSKQLEEAKNELQRANLRLKELDALKDDFISTITHELRTPLTTIRAFSEILFDNPNLELEERKRFLSLLIQESERLTRLINEVLDFEKMESGRLEWNKKEIILNEVIDQSIVSMSQLIEKKGITLTKNLVPIPVKINADFDRILQVMINLLANAVKFCPEKEGSIKIDMWLRHQVVEVRVEDNGIGIAKKDKELVFEKFRQLKPSGSENKKGSGLGLAICKNIIEKHYGQIGAEPAKQRGAIFYFTLPLIR